MLDVSLGVTPNEEAGYYSIDSKMYPIGVSIVVCTASDAAGNMGSSVFAVTVQPYVADTTPPVITVPSDTTVQIPVGHVNLSRMNESGVPMAVGNVTDGPPYIPVPFVVTATDDVGIEENVNGQPYPFCTIPTNDFVNTTGLSMTPEIINLQFGSVSLDRFNSIFFQIGTTTVTCTVSDTSGNTVTDSFTIIVELRSDDVPSPVISNFAPEISSNNFMDIFQCRYNSKCNIHDSHFYQYWHMNFQVGISYAKVWVTCSLMNMFLVCWKVL